MKSSSTKGILLVALSAIILGTNGIYARYLNLPSPVLLFFRNFLGSLILIIYLISRNKKIIFPKTDRKKIVILGILNSALSVTAFYSFMNTSIANTEILLYSFPVYLIILAPLLIKEKIDKSSLPLLFLSFLGLVMIAVSGSSVSTNQNLTGIFSGFISGVIFALYVLTAKLIRNNHDGLIMNLYQLAITVLILFPFLFLLNFEINFTKVLLLLLMGLLNSTLALSFYFSGMKYIKTQDVGIISYLEPLSAIIYALILFSEIPGPLTILGGIMILFSGYKLIARK